MAQLNQILAVEKGLQTKANDEYTQLYRELQVPSLFDGLTKTYQTALEGGDEYPSDNKGVQRTVADTLARAQEILTRRFDLVLTKDVANTFAKADVVVDGQTLLRDVPVTYLLFLEKQATEMLDFVKAVPTLDPASRWSSRPDSATGWWTTEEVRTHKTKKVENVVVLYPATKEHPAQVALRAEDVLEGYWTTRKFSGAVPRAQKQALLDRLAALAEGIKFAREKANTVEVTQMQAGDSIFSYLFGSDATTSAS